MTVLLIIGSCFATIYFCYKLAFGNRERYFQFNDDNRAPADIEMGDRGRVVLPKIEEDPNEEYESKPVDNTISGASTNAR